MSIIPGSTIGILGGGQLGRMLAIAAANIGYRTHIYAPGTSGPASEVSARPQNRVGAAPAPRGSYVIRERGVGGYSLTRRDVF